MQKLKYFDFLLFFAEFLNLSCKLQEQFQTQLNVLSLLKLKLGLMLVFLRFV